MTQCAHVFAQCADALAVWLMNDLAQQLVAAGLQVGRGRADVIAEALIDTGINEIKVVCEN